MKKDVSKIFGLGFQKTGTKSLGAALDILGYRVCGPVGAKDPDIAKNVRPLIHSLVPLYDAFQDNPWPLYLRGPRPPLSRQSIHFHRTFTGCVDR